MSKSALAKEMSKLVGAADQQGFSIKPKKNGWMVLAKDGGRAVMIHRTPSDQRAVRNARARLRAIGVSL